MTDDTRREGADVTRFGRRAIIPGISGAVILVILLVGFWVRPSKPAEIIDFFWAASVFVGGTAALLGLYFSQRALEHNQSSFQRTWELDLRAQITERFTRAVEQLGAVDNTGNQRLEIRLGGIYSLEGIARESKEYHWPSMEVLTAYVRVNAPRERGMRLRDLVLGKLLGITMLRATPEETPNDVQAVLNVLKNRRRCYKSRYYERKDYSHEDVPADESEEHRLHLAHVNLRKACLRGTHLEGASLRGANLDGALLRDAHLEEAWLQGACLQGATLKGAALKRAIFDDSASALERLNDRELLDALNTDEKFGPADLKGAILRGVHLSQRVASILACP